MTAEEIKKYLQAAIGSAVLQPSRTAEIIDAAAGTIADIIRLTPTPDARDERIAELERALAEEAEACAKVAESLPDQRGNSPEHLVGMRIAAAIRARAALTKAPTP